jgi:hypothetical protein
MTTILDRPMNRREAMAARETANRGRPMPIKTTRLEFDEDGYPEWYAVVRTNLRGAVMDDYRSGDNDRWWSSIGEIVREWNFCDEEGEPIRLPREGTTSADLPEDLLSALLRKFREAFNAQSQPPKEPSATSTPTSTTSP